jgi:C1A family cysteine protease
MRVTRLFLLLLFALFSSNTIADNCFQLCKSAEDSIEVIKGKCIYDKSTAFKFEACRSSISGLSISGNIRKYSPNYSIRVILKDKYQQEFVILESFEEINDAENFLFKDYAEETLLLDNIMPDSIKVCLTDARIQIDSITVRYLPRRDREISNKQVEIKNSQLKKKVELINKYNLKNGRPWIADITKLSLLPYETKKRLIGFSDDATSGGVEYYAGGYFVVGHGNISQNRDLGYDPYVDSFDWRNRQGKNWVSSVKNQGCTSYCATFTGIACLESLIKLYYNNAMFEVDLSEQEIASCAANAPYTFFYDMQSLSTVENYLNGPGVCDEESYPLITNCDPFDTLYCESGNITPNELFQIGITSSVSKRLRDIKAALIARGPLYSGWAPSSGPGHAMALVGYGKLHTGDSVRLFMPNTGYATIQHSLPQLYDGSTYWIFKNSYGTNIGDQGYYYLIFSDMIGTNSNVFINNMRKPYYFNLPITSMNYSDNDIIIEDGDGDGYYTWGLGSRPADCPSWIPAQPDADDSDSTKYYMDEYGYLHDVPQREPCTLTVDCNNYSENLAQYNSITIPYGCTYTLFGSMIGIGNASIIVENGGKLIIDGGIWANAKLYLSSGATLEIKNGGKIYMSSSRNFEVSIGSIANIENGEICGPYIKKSAVWQ